MSHKPARRRTHKSLIHIISGGQTGVDRAALDAAMALNVPCGGWCPADGCDELGLIPAHYPLRRLKRGGYRERTMRNVREADGTIIVYFGGLSGGTEFTLLCCMQRKKPYKLIDGEEINISRAATLLERFVRTHRIRILNVAGPRASQQPKAYDYAYRVVAKFLRRMRTAPSHH